jgi:hypothetical protein
LKVSLKQIKSLDNDNAVQEGKKLLADAVENLRLIVQKVYKEYAVFAIVNVEQHTRAKREAEVSPKAADEVSLFFKRNFPLKFT